MRSNINLLVKKERQDDVEKEECPFVIGDTVWLKSGGPSMTVAEVEDPDDEDHDGFVSCVWFGSSMEAAYYQWFRFECLTKEGDDETDSKANP